VARHSRLKSSNNNDEVGNGDASDNGNTGIFLGCSSTGPSGAKCGVPTTKNTSIKGNTADDNTKAGIALDLGDKKNDISNNDATGNTGLEDLVDENPGCDKNNWSGNSFGTASQGCIH
jgi:parallel beta-helix repeat protein